MAEPALDLDPTTVLLHDAMADREPEPGALALRLGREERIENPIELRFHDAGAVVGDGNPDELAIARRRNADRASTRDRIAGIGEEVHEDLVQLPRNPRNRWDLAIG